MFFSCIHHLFFAVIAFRSYGHVLILAYDLDHALYKLVLKIVACQPSRSLHQ